VVINSRIVVALTTVGLAAGICSTSLAAIAQTPATQNPAIDLVRATVAQELAAANDHSAKYMFRACKKTSQGSQNRIYVETRDAIAGMTVGYNDKPLTPEQLQGEKGRLAGLVDNPEQLQRKQRQEKEEEEHTLRIMRALPEAFVYDYDGAEVGTAHLGSDGKQLVRLTFRPNQAYKPPTHVEDVLVGMQGFLLIDPAAHRIARIDGTLFKEVTFGWGILGHLNQGGHFVVQQQDVGDGAWEISCMRVEFTGKILVFKSLAIKSDEEFTDFRRVPPGTTFAEGVKMLQAEESKPIYGGAETAKAEHKGR
jgi:hypothetical protein